MRAAKVMKIAINTLPLYKTKVGMGKYIVELANRLPLIDQQNTYYFYSSEHNQKYFKWNPNNIIINKIPSLLSIPFLKILLEQLYIPYHLWRNDINCYHSTGFTLPFFKPKKTRYIVTIADMTFFSHPEYHIWWKNLYFRYMIPKALRKADKIITISNNTKNDIIKTIGIAPQKIKTIYLGVDTAPLNNNALDHYNIHFPYILFVGMLEPRKNVIGLIQAYAALKNKKNHKLVIIGKKGWMYEQIFHVVKKLHIEEEVLFFGYVPDYYLPQLYQAASCFVYPSFYEGFGIPVLEAMAYGCPVITSKNSSMEEIAKGVALLVDPFNKKAIMNAINFILTHKEKRVKMRNKGFNHVKKFRWETMAEETKELYDSVCLL
jgi:glycosyltransferase involved in cell wall biosynthesis